MFSVYFNITISAAIGGWALFGWSLHPAHAQPASPIFPASAPEYLARHKLPEPILPPSRIPGEFDSQETDCPCVVWDATGERWVMAYAGWDGERNQIGLGESHDLVVWTRLGKALGTGGAGEFDRGSASGPFLFPHDGWWYLFYVGFPEQGYEAGPGTTNVARSKDLLHFEPWASAVVRPGSPEAWDGGGIYKLAVYEIGDLFYAFYNAKDTEGIEQTGFATSTDLKTWTKEPTNPILMVEPGAWDSRFVSDPCLLKISGLWHLFYYGYDGKKAQEGVAICPDGDLRKWVKYPGNPILEVGGPGTYDWKYAHKPCVIEHNGVFYHFYCGVGEERGICLATSK
jgi:predicted GH43/DUF377 family glycosyl hydrolase